MLEEGTEILDDETLLLYADFAYQDLVKRAFPNNSILTASVNFVSGVGTLPASFGTLYGDAQENPYNVYPEMSINDFARNVTGNAITFEDGELKIYPADTKTLTVRYYPTYTTLSLSQNPTIDAYFHELIIYGILARAYEDLQDDELASFYLGKYESMLKQKLSSYSLYEEGSQRGGQLFNGIGIVSDGYGGGGDPNHW